MPVTTPDSIYYADTATPSGDVNVSGAEATSVQEALDRRQVRTFKRANTAGVNAITGMAEGDLVDKADDDSIWRYNGSIWVPLLSDTGEILVGAAGGGTYGSGWSGVVNANWNGVAIRLKNSVVTINGAATKGSYVALENMLTLPVAFRPSVSKFIPAVGSAAGNYLLLRPSGSLEPALGGTGQVAFGGSYSV